MAADRAEDRQRITDLEKTTKNQNERIEMMEKINRKIEAQDEEKAALEAENSRQQALLDKYRAFIYRCEHELDSFDFHLACHPEDFEPVEGRNHHCRLLLKGKRRQQGRPNRMV